MHKLPMGGRSARRVAEWPLVIKTDNLPSSTLHPESTSFLQSREWNQKRILIRISNARSKDYGQVINVEENSSHVALLKLLPTP